MSEIMSELEKLRASLAEERLVYQRMLSKQFKLEEINADLLEACKTVLSKLQTAHDGSVILPCREILIEAIEKADQ